jgi:sugar phosphate isomerase/epimerase
MKLGAYTACLHDRSIDETLKILGELGLTSAEINTGGFIGAPHIPIDDILSSAGAREEYLGKFQQAGITLTGLNVNGNPLNPDPLVGPKHADDLRRTIDVAAALGVKRVVTMSGLPAGEPAGTVANWVVNPWDSQYMDILDYQWKEVAVPFWKDIQARAAAADVKVAIEMHPHNLVFNPPTLQRLVEQTNRRMPTRSTWAATTRSTSGRSARRGSSSRSAGATAWTTSGCRSCRRCTTPTRTWRSTSSTRTPSWIRSRVCGWPPRT